MSDKIQQRPRAASLERVVSLRCPDVTLRGGDEVVGYWARYCGMSKRQMENKRQRTGWNECDRELEAEQANSSEIRRGGPDVSNKPAGESPSPASNG